MSTIDERHHFSPSRFCGWFAALLLLGVHLGLSITATLHKTVTFDEPTHLAAGITYWTENRYDYNPENGNLPQRLAALPEVLSGYRLPESISSMPTKPELMGYAGQEAIFGAPGQAEKIHFMSHCMMLLLDFGLGSLIYYWSRILYGPLGGMISLILFVFCPNFMANDPLLASDASAALFFPAALGSLWVVMHRLTPSTFLLAVLATSGAFLSKMSAPLLAPVIILLLSWRLWRARPLRIVMPGYHRVEQGRSRITPWLFISLALCIFFVWLLIWASFGFRFTARLPGDAMGLSLPSWDFALEQSGFITNSVQWVRDHHLLPEAYLYGFAIAKRFSEARIAFFNGQISTEGWSWFFPFAVLVKTPIPTLAMLILAVLAAIVRYKTNANTLALNLRKKLLRGFDRTAPLVVFLCIYVLFSLASHLNIGLRHLLPAYTSVYILAGGVGLWLANSSLAQRMGVMGMLLALAVESLLTFPNYLTYFNQFVGGAENGYKFLVDSSLDWGQDLPDLKRYLDKEGLQDANNKTPVYLSYFGNGDIRYYDIRALILPGFSIVPQVPPDIVQTFLPGVYCISATLLEGAYWEEYKNSVKWDQKYRHINELVNQFLTTDNDQTARDDFYENYGSQSWHQDEMLLQNERSKILLQSQPTKDGGEYRLIQDRLSYYQSIGENLAAKKELDRERGRIEMEHELELFNSLRMAKLCYYLRNRNKVTPPDAFIDNTFFVYKLSSTDLEKINRLN